MRRPSTRVLGASLLAALVLGPVAAAAPDAAILTPAAERRAPEQTFLTFPEWFLVFSSAEYAQLVQHRPPSEFPFFGHVAQFWGAYRSIWGATRAYPLNSEYHVMIAVIGVSTTLEYGLRLSYETLVGRLSELGTRYGTTEEDRLAAQVAEEYVAFIRVEPWYKFDFAGALGRLWRTSLFGPDLVRKWERRYALTTEYGAKAVYGYLMRRATQASYGEAVPVTAAVVRSLPEDALAALPELKREASLPGGLSLITLPRYEAFTRCAERLAQVGAQFVEIAGNREAILVTALVPAAWSSRAAEAKLVFEQPILTQPGRKRVALVVPVASLGSLLGELSGDGLTVEHVYDY